jgi:hypothetical protein
MSVLPPSAATAATPAVIETARIVATRDAMDAFQHIDAILSAHGIEYRQTEPRFRGLSSISGDPLYRVVDDIMWDVLKLSAHVAAHHSAAVQARVDVVTATVLVSLNHSKPMMTLKDRDSLLYRCVRETTHVFGPETIAVIASRYDQCFREKELLDTEAMDLFEQRYHHKVLDGYTARTCRPPPYSAAV